MNLYLTIVSRNSFLSLFSFFQDKKKMYTEQVKKQMKRRTSFLDSIRAEIDDGENVADGDEDEF